MSDQRMAAVRDWMAEEDLDALLVSSRPNVRYLTGFTGEGLLVLDEGALICTDRRYTVQAGEEAPGIECGTGKSHLECATGRLRKGGHARVGFEAPHLTCESHATLAEGLEGVELVPCGDQIKRLRAVKDEEELSLVQRAAGIADAAFVQWREWLEPGVTEREAALELERLMVVGGAERASFEVIVAGGPNGAKPHARPGSREIVRDELVVVDWGAVFEGYCSDCTRTVVVGELDEKQREVWEAVREAQLAGIEALRPGLEGREVDAVARELLRERGYGEEFGHGVGHGVGLEVHELPGLGSSSEDELRPGNVVTVEPGVYIEGWGGVRLEELMAVTEDGGRRLTRAPYDL